MQRRVVAGYSPFKLMTSLMVKVNGRFSYVSVFDDTRSSKLRLAADSGECRAGGESLCVVCCCPLQKARSKRSTSLTSNRLAWFGRIKDEYLATPSSRTRPTLLEDVRRSSHTRNWLRVILVVPRYAASGISAKPSLVHFSSPWQRREDHLPCTRSYSNPSTASQS